VNPRFAEIFGYDRKEIEFKKPADSLVHPKDRDLVVDKMKRRLNGEVVTQEYEFRGITCEGKTVNVHVFSSAITYLDKPAVVGTLLDVTETKEAIKKYKSSVQSFEDLFNSISDAIYIQDNEGKFIKVNDAAVELNGYDRDFLLGNVPDVLAAPGKVDLDETWGYFEDALHGTTRRFQQWGLRKSGEVFPEEVVLNPGSYFGEDVVIAVSRDISERYKAEQQLRESEEMFRQLFQNAPFSIAFMDKHQEIREINAAFSETFGFEIDEVKGLNIDKLIVPGKSKEKAKTISEAVLDGRTIQDFGKRRRKDGNLIDVLIYGVPVKVNGKTIAIFGIYVDITDRKKAEEQVKKPLKEKEVLLAEIHHRVKNNLAVITGLLELQIYNTDSGDATEVLKSSQMRINSIALIHEKLYQNEDLSQISFDIYLEELTDVILSSLRSSETKVTVNIDAEPIELTISQAIPCGLILNELITNANKHAFPNQDTGNIVITLTEEDNLVRLTVVDNGVGIPDDADLENPKSLGLKLIRTLSKQLSGKSSFSDNNPGTKFSLEFDLEE
jgi:PAS domain S-box-containing protein